MPIQIVNVTQADLDKLPPEIRGNARAMNLIRTVLTTFTKLEQMLGYDLVLVASGTPPVSTSPGVPATPGNLAPRRIAHGQPTHVPLADKSGRRRGKERIHRRGPFNDFRVLEVGDDAFLDSFILAAVREAEGYFIGDDLARGDVVYVFDHWSIIYSTDNTPTNPIPLFGVSTRTFRAWWRCHRKASPT